MRFFFVSDVARQVGVKPRRISDLFYDRVLDDSKCPIVSGRRIIPADYVPVIEQCLREHGFLAQTQGTVAE